MKYTSLSLIALVFATAAAQAPAQPVAAAPNQAGAASSKVAAARPDSGAATVASSFQVSDREVDQFAKAVLVLKKIDSDGTLDENSKQDRMAAAVVAIGLDPARYNQIGEAATIDDALRARVETALARYSDPGPDVA